VRPKNFVVPIRKLTEYLLNLSHPEGRTKAAFFLAHGFSPKEPDQLARALEAQARFAPQVSSRPGFRGMNLIFVGPLATPSGKQPWIASVWYLEEGSESARLVTAYPYRRRK